MSETFWTLLPVALFVAFLATMFGLDRLAARHSDHK